MEILEAYPRRETGAYLGHPQNRDRPPPPHLGTGVNGLNGTARPSQVRPRRWSNKQPLPEPTKALRDEPLVHRIDSSSGMPGRRQREGFVSDISRRKLLGYSGTAAAGAVFASTSAADAAEADSATTTVEFMEGSEFRADARMSESDLMMDVSFKLRVDKPNGYPSAQDITPLEVAEALSALAQSKGWPPLTFYGTPPPVALN
ncbi:hypothetical protein ACIA9I_38095 [Streptomyces anulatus]